MITQINSSSSFLFNYGSASNSSQTYNWTRPNLTENGMMGGSTCACEAIDIFNSYYVYKAFNASKTGTDGWMPSGRQNKWITFYTPTPIKATKITIICMTQRYIIDGYVSVSNDNSSWTQVGTFSSNSNLTLNINLNTSGYYKYYKLYITNGYCSDAGFLILDWDFTATYQTIAIGGITFPMTYSNTNYSYAVTYYGGEIGGSYVKSITASGMSLQNNSSATKIKYMTIGY